MSNTRYEVGQKVTARTHSAILSGVVMWADDKFVGVKDVVNSKYTECIDIRDVTPR